MNKTTKSESLKELENLLEKDIKKGGSICDPQSSRGYLMGMIIRISVSLVIFTILFLVGFIKHLNLILVALAIVGVIELFRFLLWKRKSASQPGSD